MTTTKQSAFSLVGNDKPSRYGVMAAFDAKAKVLTLRLDLSEKAIKGAPMSSTGKSKLVGNTSGFTPFEFDGGKLNSNVCATIKA